MAIFAVASRPAFAQTFREAVDLARTSEPTYLSARASAVAAEERTKIAKGGLLPQVSATAASNANHRNYDTNGVPTAAVDSYNSNSAQLSLTQPVFRPANINALRQAEAAQTQAEFQLVAAEQELMAKLVSAWLDTMSARDAMLFTTRQAAATRQQADILTRGVALGTAASPALEDALAKHEQALAERVAAEMDFQVKTGSLEQIIGPAPGFVPPFFALRGSYEPVGNPSLDQWLEWSARSPQIRAAEQNLVAAEEEIGKQRAGHLPTVDVVSSYGRNAQQVGTFPVQPGFNVLQGIIGLQVAVPIFSGGSQSAKVDEAIANRDKVRQDLVAVQRATRLAAKQAWYGWQAALVRRNAALQSAKSALVLLRAAAVGIGAGVKTNLDRLQAQQQVESARRDFNRSRYDITLSLVKLKAVAGRLSDEDIARLDSLFLLHEDDVRELVSMN